MVRDNEGMQQEDVSCAGGRICLCTAHTWCVGAHLHVLLHRLQARLQRGAAVQGSATQRRHSLQRREHVDGEEQGTVGKEAAGSTRIKSSAADKRAHQEHKGPPQPTWRATTVTAATPP